MPHNRFLLDRGLWAEVYSGIGATFCRDICTVFPGVFCVGWRSIRYSFAYLLCTLYVFAPTTGSSEIVELIFAMRLIISLRLCCDELLSREVLPCSIETCRRAVPHHFFSRVGWRVPIQLPCHCRRGAPLPPRPLCDARSQAVCSLLGSACLGYYFAGRSTEAKPGKAEEEEAAPLPEACPSFRYRLLGRSRWCGCSCLFFFAFATLC